MLLALPIIPDPLGRHRDLTSTLRVAREHGLTTYDAAYLELALRVGAPLATLDSALGTAPKAAGVTRWNV